MLTRGFRLRVQWLKRTKWLWPFAVVAALGLARALLTYNIWFNFEDQSTFFTFGRNILHGEVIYKDFIHFRTPGFYFLSAAFQWVFGQTLGTEQLLLALESYVLSPLLLCLAAWLITRRRWVAVGLGLIATVLPGVLQLRAGLALLAVATYVVAQTAATSRDRHRWLFVSGLFVGLTFVFGQETGILTACVLGLCELRFSRTLPLLIRRVRSLALGAGAALLPLVVYVVVFSDVRNFLYYVFKYALVIQPTGMNLPYPHLVPPTQYNVMFYVPFLVLLAAFAVFYLADDLNVINLPVLVLATVRMVTALGRADEGHLIFALPEILLLIPLAAASIHKMKLSAERLWMLAVWSIAIVCSFWGATTKGSFVIVGAALVYVFASLRSRADYDGISPVFSGEAVALTITGWTMVVLAFIFPIYNFAKAPLQVGWQRHFGPDKQHVTPAHWVSGVPIAGAEFQEVDAISRLVDRFHPTVLFSYPVQPFYYSLVPRHAARFMTFEPQTTPEEEAEAIADLKRNKPQLVILDVLQAQAWDKSVGRINEYVRENYKPVAEVNYRRPLTVLVPRHKGD
jgi:hypothetical protein